MADVGRPTIMTDDVVNKLEEAFSNDATDLEACWLETENGVKYLIDREDIDRLKKYKWYFWKGKRGNYIYCNKKLGIGLWKRQMLHREILNVNNKNQVDHINFNGLDNRKKNLRICTPGQNVAYHKKQKNNTSGYKGVSWSKTKQLWEAYINYKNKKKCLGFFKDKVEAAKKYDQEALNIFGEYAVVNF